MKPFAGFLVRVRRSRDSELPVHPLAAAVPEFCLALLAAAIGFAGFAWQGAAIVVGALVLVALYRATRAAVELGRRRRSADEWLLWGATIRPSSALLSWRARELMSPRLRSTLAHGLLRIERETRGKTLPGAVPLNKRALRCHLGLLCLLQRRLADQDRLVSVRGILLVDRLLTEPGSALYSSVPDDVVAEALTDALAALDPVSVAVAA
jgi:hypothetical protein